ncbi:MAG: class I SAM-dependent methyltransferase [Cyanobacteriota bacterium]|jgi:SAM-dependent methyltransferase
MATPRVSPLGTPLDFWNKRYSEEGFAYGSDPNEFLREQAAALKPGSAICLAEGEGRNAVHLARLGHRVMAQDLSPVGLLKASRLAASHGVSIETHCCDLVDFQPEPESVDLVVAIWMHLPPALRAKVHRQAAAALRPAGLLILEAYTPRQLELATGGPPSSDLLVEPDALRFELEGLEFLVLEEKQRWIEEGPYHRGESAVVQAVGRKPAKGGDQSQG